MGERNKLTPIYLTEFLRRTEVQSPIGIRKSTNCTFSWWRAIPTCLSKVCRARICGACPGPGAGALFPIFQLARILQEFDRLTLIQASEICSADRLLG